MADALRIYRPEQESGTVSVGQLVSGTQVQHVLYVPLSCVPLSLTEGAVERLHEMVRRLPLGVKGAADVLHEITHVTGGWSAPDGVRECEPFWPGVTGIGQVVGPLWFPGQTGHPVAVRSQELQEVVQHRLGSLQRDTAVLQIMREG